LGFASDNIESTTFYSIFLAKKRNNNHIPIGRVIEIKPHLIFVAISTVLLAIIIYLIPKNLKKHEIYTMSVLAILLGTTADLIFAVKYNLYILVTEDIDYSPIFVGFFIYPAFNLIILNYFPYKKSLWQKIIYIFIWTIISLLYEVISVKVDFLHYRTWTLLYSAIVYPIVIIFFSYNLYLYRKLVKDNLNE